MAYSQTATKIIDNIWNNELSFSEKALQLFAFQYHHVPVYQQWCQHLQITVADVTHWHQIPFLPIQFFKTHQVLVKDGSVEEIFTSSGTTGVTTSSHYVHSLQLYQQSFLHHFTQQYGDPTQYCIVGLLPNYLERTGSSLVYMVQHLIEQSQHADSGFYLHNFDALAALLLKNEAANVSTILFGVTFALLEFAAAFPMTLKNTIVIETGGMKGRGKELTKMELYQTLQTGLGLANVGSEYGMTELLSQAYATANGIFSQNNLLQVLLREEDDPLQIHSTGRGLLNLVDLANVFSCSFIATDDVAHILPNGDFEILGRRDNSDLRGCSLLVV